MFAGLTNVKNTNPFVNTKGLGSDNTMVNGIATQNLGGNSLTQTLRSAQNYQGTQGTNLLQQGGDITTAALPGFNTAGDTSQMGVGTTQAALNTLSPAEDYWTRILSGDSATMRSAIAPATAQAGTNYANAASNVAMNSPRGGYSALTTAMLPQAMARETNAALYNLQPTAATNLNTIAGTKNALATTQGNIAGIQGQIANWLASIGIDVSKLGSGLLDQLTQSLLGGRGQDVQEHGQAMQLAGQAISDYTNLAGKLATA